LPGENDRRQREVDHEANVGAKLGRIVNLVQKAGRLGYQRQDQKDQRQNGPAIAVPADEILDYPCGREHDQGDIVRPVDPLGLSEHFF
jgi:hypothetical protein